MKKRRIEAMLRELEYLRGVERFCQSVGTVSYTGDLRLVAIRALIEALKAWKGTR